MFLITCSVMLHCIPFLFITLLWRIQGLVALIFSEDWRQTKDSVIYSVFPVQGHKFPSGNVPTYNTICDCLVSIALSSSSM